ncbi:unnamed protein product [Gongylonema pulchrum]|uniref:Phage major capsid protein n=1 Tax=Gongylonema pulchrum TaxID=637853 RepID=A0A183DKW7_9BILA|nr:unnamed protein product [Gongylonema pulchrum]
MQAVSMHYCPANAFSGLKHMKHIWFRNTTIGTLAAGAFSDVADVDYIYFRDSVIKVIEDGAFGESILQSV